jgi:peptide/nickel transport system permease protein
MQAFVVRRLVLALPTVFVVSFLAFGMIRLNPDAIVVARLGENYNQDQAARLKADYGLDKPFYTEYFHWMGKVASGDLGTSALSYKPVAKEMGPKVVVTFEFALLAVIFAVLIGVPIGVISAVQQDRWPDYVLRSLALLGLSVPGYYLATIVLTFLAIKFHWIPALEYTPFWDNPGKNLVQFALPAFLLSLGNAAQLMRFARTMMLDILRQDYIRTAWAKGLRGRAVIARHALRNAMLPVITVLGLTMTVLVGGTVIFEQIFNLPGMGSYLIYSVTQKDFAPIQGVVLFFAFSVIVINLLVDISYVLIDPRTKP